MSKKIAIFGGAFNPPHIGHAEIVKLLAKYSGCDEIWLMPSADRRDKIIPIAREDRLAMIDLIIKDCCPDLEKPILISSFELEQKKPSITYETKYSLEKAYPDYEFYFVMGSDIIPDIKKSWIKGQELFDSAKFIFIERLDSHRLKSLELPKNFLFIEADIPTISSTYLRNLKSYDDLARYTSPRLAAYIKERKLYL